MIAPRSWTSECLAQTLTTSQLLARLGLRLLTRSTRSVAPTEAGERLLRAVGPRLEEIDAELAALSELREKPAGMVRITAHDHAVRTVLWPTLTRLQPDYPDIRVEVAVDSGLTDIVTERFDAGIRTGEMVAKDMVAVRVGPDMRSAVVGAPSWLVCARVGLTAVGRLLLFMAAPPRCIRCARILGGRDRT